MGKKNFLLLSLDDDKAKSIANTVSNATCKKILDFLSDKDGTETQISEALKIPISTVHYNLKQLVDSKLVEIESSTYSEKGKEVKSYTLANKYIIIAPKGANKESFLEAVKSIIPIGLLGVLGAYAVSSFTSINQAFNYAEPQMMMAKSSPEVAEMGFMAAGGAAYSDIAPNSALTSTSLIDIVRAFEPWEWFLFGFTFAILCVWVSSKIKQKIKNKKIKHIIK